MHNRGSLRGQRRVSLQILQEETSRLQPLYLKNKKQTDYRRAQFPTSTTLRTARCSGHHHHVFDQWQDNMLPTRLLQGHILVNTIAATRV